MASKAQHIRLLYDAGASIADIAAMLNVSAEYVRVCARQRRNGNYRADNLDKRKAYAHGDRDAARKAQTDAYRKWRSRGLTVDAAKSKVRGVYANVMIATGRQRRFEKLVAQEDVLKWQVDVDGNLPPEVHPINDLRPHVLASDGGSCWCGAKPDDEGVIVHTALDGREAYEPLLQ